MKETAGEPYVWSIPETYPERLIGHYVAEGVPDSLEFKKGVEVSLEAKVLNFQYSATLGEVGAFDVLANDALLPLVGERAAAILSRIASASVQLLPVSLECVDGRDGSYRLMNVTRTVRGIDHRASKYSLIRGTDKILGFQRLRYRSDCLGDLAIARDEEYKPHILVSDALRRAFAAAEVCGVRLEDPANLVA
jgi:hypothetical protein